MHLPDLTPPPSQYMQAWLLKSETVVAQQMVGRTREALTDYANALLLQDWHEEQRAARRAGLVLDG